MIYLQARGVTLWKSKFSMPMPVLVHPSQTLHEINACAHSIANITDHALRCLLVSLRAVEIPQLLPCDRLEVIVVFCQFSKSGPGLR